MLLNEKNSRGSSLPQRLRLRCCNCAARARHDVLGHVGIQTRGRRRGTEERKISLLAATTARRERWLDPGGLISRRCDEHDSRPSDAGPATRGLRASGTRRGRPPAVGVSLGQNFAAVALERLSTVFRNFQSPLTYAVTGCTPLPVVSPFSISSRSSLTRSCRTTDISS